MFPDTTKTGGHRPHVVPVVTVVCCGLLLVAVVSFLGRRDFAPGEELISPGVEDIAVSRKDTTYPDSDTPRFEEGLEVVYVYLRVEDLAADGDLRASVERRSWTSVLGRLLGGSGLRVVDAGEERLGASGGGVLSVVKFAVRPDSGRRLPPGNYTVEVHTDSGGADESGVVARKYFAVSD